MKKALFHIGLPKTGTTSIQKMLFDDLDLELLPGVDYHLPFVERFQSQHLLWGLFRNLENMSRWPKFEIEQLGGIEVVKPYLEQCWEKIKSSQKVIISSEYLSLFSHQELSALKQNLRGARFYEIYALMYVRHPIKFYLSLVQQTVKADSVFQSPDKFSTRYRHFIEKNSGIFDKMFVRSFEREALYKECVVQDFSFLVSQLFDVHPNYSAMKGVQRNESLSAEAMILLQQWYRNSKQNGIVTTEGIKVVSVLQKLRNFVPQTTPRLNSLVQDIIWNNCSDDMKSLVPYGIEFDFTKMSTGKSSVASIDFSEVSSILEFYNKNTLKNLTS